MCSWCQYPVMRKIHRVCWGKQTQQLNLLLLHSYSFFTGSSLAILVTSYKHDCMHYCNKYGYLKGKLMHKVINNGSSHLISEVSTSNYIIEMVAFWWYWSVKIAFKTICQIFFLAQFNRTTHMIYTVRCIKICVDFTQITCGTRTSDIIFYTGNISWDVLDHLSKERGN